MTKIYTTNTPWLENQSRSVAGHWQDNLWGWGTVPVFPWPVKVFGQGLPAPFVMLSFSLSIPAGSPCPQHRLQEVPCRDPKSMPDFILRQLFLVVESHWIQLRQKWNRSFSLSLYFLAEHSMSTLKSRTKMHDKDLSWRAVYRIKEKEFQYGKYSVPEKS